MPFSKHAHFAALSFPLNLMLQRQNVAPTVESKNALTVHLSSSAPTANLFCIVRGIVNELIGKMAVTRQSASRQRDSGSRLR